VTSALTSPDGIADDRYAKNNPLDGTKKPVSIQSCSVLFWSAGRYRTATIEKSARKKKSSGLTLDLRILE